MKKATYIFVVATALAMTSCTTIKKTSSTSEINTNIYQYPTVADIEIMPKIKYNVEWGFVPFNWGQPPIETRKGNMMADVLKSNDADILLEPQFIYEKTSYGKRSLTVIGFPAKFKNFRKASKEDLEAMKATKHCQKQERTEYNRGRRLLGIF